MPLQRRLQLQQQEEEQEEGCMSSRRRAARHPRGGAAHRHVAHHVVRSCLPARCCWVASRARRQQTAPCYVLRRRLRPLLLQRRLRQLVHLEGVVVVGSLSWPPGLCLLLVT